MPTTSTPSTPTSALRLSEQRIVVRDLTLSVHVGVSEAERRRPQRLRLNVELELAPRQPLRDGVEEVINYGRVIKELRAACLASEAQLLETLAGELAAASCIDPRVHTVRIRIEKLDRYADTGGIGVAMTYARGAG